MSSDEGAVVKRTRKTTAWVAVAQGKRVCSTGAPCRVLGCRLCCRTFGGLSGRGRSGKVDVRRLMSLGPELKFLETYQNFFVDSTIEVPATGQLNLIPQASNSTSRIGRKVVITSIKQQLQFTHTELNGDGCVIYGYVVLDRQCNGAAATPTDVFVLAGSAYCLLRPDQEDRFVILHKYMLESNPPLANVPFCRAVEWETECNIPIEFDSSVATGAITSIRSNNLFLIFGLHPTNADDAIKVDGVTRVTFRDD